MLTLTDAFSHLSYFIYAPKLFDVITCKQVFVPSKLIFAMGACTKVASFPERNIHNFSENVQNEDE